MYALPTRNLLLNNPSTQGGVKLIRKFLNPTGAATGTGKTVVADSETVSTFATVTDLTNASRLVGNLDEYFFQIGNDMETPLKSLVRFSDNIQPLVIASTAKTVSSYTNTGLTLGQSELTTSAAHGYVVGDVLFVTTAAVGTITSNNRALLGQSYVIVSIVSSTKFVIANANITGTLSEPFGVALVDKKAEKENFIKYIPYAAAVANVMEVTIARTAPIPTSVVPEQSLTLRIRLDNLNYVSSDSDQVSDMTDILIPVYISRNETTTTTPAELAKLIAQNCSGRRTGLQALPDYDTVQIEYQKVISGTPDTYEWVNAYNASAETIGADTFSGKLRFTSKKVGWRVQAFMTSPDYVLDYLTRNETTAASEGQGTYALMESKFTDTVRPFVVNDEIPVRGGTYDTFCWRTKKYVNSASGEVPGGLNYNTVDSNLYVLKSASGELSNIVTCLRSLSLVAFLALGENGTL